ncbi:MAG: choice-of-anchor tandem repeat NxxGxxAF-containing protein [Thermodesulfobacteriota bacterium]
MPMKRFSATLGILAALTWLGVGPAAAGKYVTTQISTLGGAYLGLFPKINNRGEVAWAGNYYDSPGLYLYSHGVVKQLTNNPNIQNFDINDLGQVVWSGLVLSPYGYNIFLYKNGVTTQVTTDGNNNFDPSFNDYGDFVWNTYDGSKARIKLCTSAGSISTYWTCPTASEININYVFPVINNQGQVAWANYTLDNLDHIYLDGVLIHSSPSFISSLGYTDPLYSLNNNGDLVFSSSDGIWLKKNGASIQLIATTDNRSYRPRINDSGLVAYVGDSTAFTTAVFLYSSATGSQKITDNGVYPFLNSKGQVIWTNNQGIYSYYQNASSLIINYTYSVYPTLNDRGQVAFQGPFSGDGIFLSRPAAGQPWLPMLLD